MTGCASRPTVAIDHLDAQLAAYRDVDRQIRDLKEMRVRIRQAITEALGEHQIGTVRGRTAVRYTTFDSRRLSPELLHKRFTEEQLADCYSVSVIRKFQVIS